MRFVFLRIRAYRDIALSLLLLIRGLTGAVLMSAMQRLILLRRDGVVSPDHDVATASLSLHYHLAGILVDYLRSDDSIALVARETATGACRRLAHIVAIAAGGAVHRGRLLG